MQPKELGTTSGKATNVTVNNTNATRYSDYTFASVDTFGLVDGTNTFTAIAKDSYGNKDTNTVAVDLPAMNSFIYDSNAGLRTNGVWRFDWEDENQLRRVTLTNQFKKEFYYDGLHRMKLIWLFTWSGGAWVKTNEVRLICDGNVPIQHRDTNSTLLTLTRGLDLSGSLSGANLPRQSEATAGGIGGLLAMTEGSGTNTYYHSDGNGNVTCLIDTNQMIAARYSYTPFGITLSLSGPKADLNPYRFSSQYYDADTDLYLYRYRVYVPRWQRWLNPDRIGEDGGINLYGFVGNDGVNEVDPLGLSPAWPLNFNGQSFAPPASTANGLTIQGLQNAITSGLEATVPGQASWNQAMNALWGGHTAVGASWLSLSLSEMALGIASMGMFPKPNFNPPPCPPTKIDDAIEAIEDFLGGQGTVIKNADGDTILIHGNKKIRFDVKDPHGDKPHFHIEQKTPKGKWKDAGPQHRYYIKEQ